jgi:hypothetical protein
MGILRLKLIFAQLCHPKLAEKLGDLIDKEAVEMDNKFPDMYKRAQQDEGIVLDCYHWFFRVALDAIGIGE